MKVKSRKEFGVIFWMHLLLVVMAYSSPIWLDWKVILAGVALLQIYYMIRGGCDLTFAEFGKGNDTTFVWYYLSKLIALDQKKTKFFVRIIIPIILVLVSFISQFVYSYQPIISI